MLKIILTIVISLHKWGEIAIFPSRSFFCCLASKILLPREESLFSILTIVMMLVKSVLKFHYMQKFHQTTIRRIIPDGGCVSYLKLSSNHNPPRPDKSLHGVVSYPKSSSNHNLVVTNAEEGRLYLILNHHQTTTMFTRGLSAVRLYLILNHHQTTTSPVLLVSRFSLYLILNHHQTTTASAVSNWARSLYLILNHHQTTTEVL